MKMIFRKGSKLKRRADNKRNDTKSIIARPLFSFTLLPPSDSFLSVATTFTTVDVIVRPNVTGDRKKKKLRKKRERESVNKTERHGRLLMIRPPFPNIFDV
jgi:hypothetical protein